MATDFNFFFEKLIQKNHLRGFSYAQARKGTTEDDPTYFIVDALKNKRKLTIDDVFELKNPSARLAKALVEIRPLFNSLFLKKEEAPGFAELSELETFMRKIRLWSKQDIKEMDEENKMLGTEEMEPDLQLDLKELIMERLLGNKQFVEVFERDRRMKLRDKILEAKRLKLESRESKSLSYEELKKLTSRSKVEHFEQEDFLKLFLSTNLTPEQALNLPEKSLSWRPLIEVLLELFPQNLVSKYVPLPGYLKERLRARAEREKEANAAKEVVVKTMTEIENPVIPSVGSPITFKSLMKNLPEYRSVFTKRMIFDDKLDRIETRKIHKMIEEYRQNLASQLLDGNQYPSLKNLSPSTLSLSTPQHPEKTRRQDNLKIITPKALKERKEISIAEGIEGQKVDEVRERRVGAERRYHINRGYVTGRKVVRKPVQQPSSPPTLTSLMDMTERKVMPIAVKRVQGGEMHRWPGGILRNTSLEILPGTSRYLKRPIGVQRKEEKLKQEGNCSSLNSTFQNLSSLIRVKLANATEKEGLTSRNKTPLRKVIKLKKAPQTPEKQAPHAQKSQQPQARSRDSPRHAYINFCTAIYSRLALDQQKLMNTLQGEEMEIENIDTFE